MSSIASKCHATSKITDQSTIRTSCCPALTIDNVPKIVIDINKPNRISEVRSIGSRTPLNFSRYFIYISYFSPNDQISALSKINRPDGFCLTVWIKAVANTLVGIGFIFVNSPIAFSLT